MVEWAPLLQKIFAGKARLLWAGLFGGSFYLYRVHVGRVDPTSPVVWVEGGVVFLGVLCFIHAAEWLGKRIYPWWTERRRRDQALQELEPLERCYLCWFRKAGWTAQRLLDNDAIRVAQQKGILVSVGGFFDVESSHLKVATWVREAIDRKPDLLEPKLEGEEKAMNEMLKYGPNDLVRRKQELGHF